MAFLPFVLGLIRHAIAVKWLVDVPTHEMPKHFLFLSDKQRRFGRAGAKYSFASGSGTVVQGLIMRITA